MKLTKGPGTLFVLVVLVAGVMGYGNSHHTGAAASTVLSDPNTNQRGTPEIAGNYNVNGTNTDGTSYRGELAIIRHGDVYQFRWNAGQQYDGVGIEIGNVVAVAFSGGSNGKGCGVVTYKVLADGTLDGRWGYWGVNESGAERATHTSGVGLAGNYNVTGSNPDGKTYKAALSIKPKAAGYEFSWSNDASGFGIKQGNSVSVGIGGPRCGFVSYLVKPDGSLEGIWGGYGSDQTGTEMATKK